MYYLIHEYGDWSHSEILCESEDYKTVKAEFDFAVKQTLEETDSTTDALYIEDLESQEFDSHTFTEEPKD